MTRNEKIQAAAAVLQERALQAIDSTAFKVTITDGDGENPAVELTPDRERIRQGTATEDLMCHTFYHMDTVVDVARTFHLICYFTLQGDSYCVRIY